MSDIVVWPIFCHIDPISTLLDYTQIDKNPMHEREKIPIEQLKFSYNPIPFIHEKINLWYSNSSCAIKGRT